MWGMHSLPNTDTTSAQTKEEKKEELLMTAARIGQTYEAKLSNSALRIVLFTRPSPVAVAPPNLQRPVAILFRY